MKSRIFIRWFILLSLLALIGMVSFELIRRPAIIATAGSQSPVYLTLLVAAICIYAWFAVFRSRGIPPENAVALQNGAWVGILCGVFWIIELLAANVFSPHNSGPLLFVYFISTFAGLLLPGLAGFLAGRQTQSFGAGLQAGVLCGMLGGLMIFLSTLFLLPLLQSAGQADPQTLAEFQRSGLPDLETYIVGDYLAGMIAHLWIGLITGLVFGAGGSALGKMGKQRI